MPRKIVCLCGSTKFKSAFELANREETLKGNVVLSVGFFLHSDDTLSISDEQKLYLDYLHLDKIKMADEVIILNVDGYVGNSTFNELQFSYGLGKAITFLEPDNIPDHCKRYMS